MKKEMITLGILSIAFIFLFGSCEKQEIEKEPSKGGEIDTVVDDIVVIDSINVCNDTILDSTIVAFYNKHGNKLNDYMWNIMTTCDSVVNYNFFIKGGELNLLYYWDGMTRQDSINVYICNKLNCIDYYNYIRYTRYTKISNRQDKIFIYFDYIVGDSIFYCEKTKRNEPAFNITMNDTIIVSRLSHVVIDSLLNKYPY